jgi:NAD(P)-dependent dehydrogenase (short-subunit alcohol dehydrogenase family)
LVTGAGKGLGEAAAKALALAGAKVLVTDIAPGNGQRVVGEIKAAGGEAEFMPHDVTQEAHWETAVKTAIERFGRLDILINNAGIETAALLAECTLEDFKTLMEINVTGVFLGLKHAIRAMSPGGPSGHGGSIINLSSAAGLRGYIGHTAYCTSKGAVRLMTKAAAVECAQLGLGIRVNSLHPGIIDTDMGVNFVRSFVTLGLSPDFEAANQGALKLFPMGHFGQPDDVANAILYMASDAAKWVTGAELSIDGGLSAA